MEARMLSLHYGADDGATACDGDFRALAASYGTHAKDKVIRLRAARHFERQTIAACDIYAHSYILPLEYLLVIILLAVLFLAL